MMSGLRLPWRAGRPTALSDDSLIRRIGWQLALVTTLLLFALLLAMGSAVYLKSESDLLQPVQQLLQIRAHQEALMFLSHGRGHVRGEHVHHHRPPPRSPLGPGFGGESEPVIAGVYVYDTNKLRVVRHSNGGPRGSRLPSPSAAREALQDGEPDLTTMHVASGPYLVYTLPLKRHGRVTGVVQTATSQSQYVEGLRAVLQILIVVGILGLVAVVVITLIVVQRALRPIRVSLQRQRDFVADAAHELRTPLTIIRSAAELSIGDADGDEQQRAELTLKQTMHLTRLVSDLSLLARADTGTIDLDIESLDLSDLVAEVVSDLEMVAEERNITIEPRLAEGVHVRGDLVRCRQLLLILLDNALKHSPDGGRVVVELERSRREAVVRVNDSGPGIRPKDLLHVFERFYRSPEDRSGDGSGLGLAIARSLAEAHGGHISAENAAGGGAVFTLTLPLTAGSSESTAGSREPEVGSRQQVTGSRRSR